MVDVRPAINRYATPQPPASASPWQQPQAPTELLPAEPAPDSERASRAANAARCELLWRAIDQNDAAARAGGSAQHQDWLRVQRRKLEDERFERRC